jgi:hypothetical protein
MRLLKSWICLILHLLGYLTDHLNYDEMDGGNWTELLSSKWFGSNDPYTGQIIDGRWANLHIPFMDSEFYINEG